MVFVNCDFKFTFVRTQIQTFKFKIMVKVFKGLMLALALMMYTGAIQAQTLLSDEEYAYVTMDLRGILDLTMTTDPQVSFTFATIQEYMNGITKFNATKLEVDATVAWDLFAYASTDNWTQVQAYSTTGTNVLPAEILEIQSSVENTTAATDDFDSFVSLKGLANSGVALGVPTADTQFLSGMKGLASAAGDAEAPGTAYGNPSTHQFRLHHRLKPGVPAEFGNSTVALGGVGEFAMAGYYYLEIVYSLVEDL